MHLKFHWSVKCNIFFSLKTYSPAPLQVHQYAKNFNFSCPRKQTNCLISGILLKKKNMIEEIKLECAEKFNEEVSVFFSYYFSIL
jgi:hypothetical protein